MPAKRISTTLPAVNAVDYALLVGKSDIFNYENGKRVGETRIGVRLTIALQNSKMEQLSVKYDKDPLPSIGEEAIEQACSELKFLLVQIPDCEVVLYNTTNGIGMTASATSAKIVTLSNGK